MATEDVLLLRVGLDSSSGRGHGPLFEDDSFEYVPIPESAETAEARTYDDLPARTGGRLSAHAPHLADRVPHFDPEFESFTYGDPSRNKRSQLSRLTTDDLLIFYSSLSPQDVDAGPRLCVIGYFVVDTVYDLAALTPAERDAAFEAVENNAHVKRTGLTREASYRERYPVVVKGDPERSRLLARPVPLGKADRTVLPWVADIIGFEKDLTRAGVARVLDEGNAAEIRRWLTLGSDYLVAEDADFLTHVTGPGAGTAPNVTGEYCTLEASELRGGTDLDAGDWLLGTSDDGGRLASLVRVDEVTSRDERFTDERPENDPRERTVGDGENARPEQDPTKGARADRHRRRQGRKTDHVVVSSLFWYFGESGVTLPERLCTRVRDQYESGAGGVDPRRGRDTLRELVSWSSLRFDPGVNEEAARVANGGPSR